MLVNITQNNNYQAVFTKNSTARIDYSSNRIHFSSDRTHFSSDRDLIKSAFNQHFIVLGSFSTLFPISRTNRNKKHNYK